MKTFRYLIYSTSILLAAGMASCTQEEFKPGEPDLENCYGVYFDDVQQNAGSLMLDPSDPRTLTFSVSRLKEDGALSTSTKPRAARTILAGFHLRILNMPLSMGRTPCQSISRS